MKWNIQQQQLSLKFGEKGQINEKQNKNHICCAFKHIYLFIYNKFKCDDSFQMSFHDIDTVYILEKLTQVINKIGLSLTLCKLKSTTANSVLIFANKQQLQQINNILISAFHFNWWQCNTRITHENRKYGIYYYVVEIEYLVNRL